MTEQYVFPRQPTCVCGPDHYRADHHSSPNVELRILGIKGGCRITGCDCPEYREVPA